MRRGAALLALALLAGCGGDDSGGGPAPRDTLQAAQDAIREVRSYHVEGTDSDADGTMAIAADVGPDGARVRVDEGDGVTAELRLIGEDEVYVRGSRGFWADSGAKGAVLALLTRRWVKMPPQETFSRLARGLQPRTLSTCIGEDLGTLRHRGTEEIDGRRVDVIEDAGDKPGSAPGLIYVAADDPRLILRTRQTGPEREGGSPSPECESEGNDDTTASLANFSRFGEPVVVRAPADPLDLEDAERRAAGGSTV